MLSKDRECQSFEQNDPLTLSVTSSLVQTEDALLEASVSTATRFYSRYTDCMELYAPPATVAKYLDNHASWFIRCAQPMKVEPLGKNGYALVIGRFGSFGYEVEPKIGLELLPSEQGIYRIVTIPIPDYQAPGYDVDYQASLQLVESDDMTRVEWELNLTVDIYFPRFIQRLPKPLIQSTGDRLLNQIVRQVSHRLTRKVQEDFYVSLGVPFPGKSKRR
jgi:hypothetical protein